MGDYNKMQVLARRWHRAVLPDMIVEAANDLSGDANTLAEELKKCSDVVLRLRRNEFAVERQHQWQQRLRAVHAFSSFPSTPSTAAEQHAILTPTIHSPKTNHTPDKYQTQTNQTPTAHTHQPTANKQAGCLTDIDSILKKLASSVSESGITIEPRIDAVSDGGLTFATVAAFFGSSEDLRAVIAAGADEGTLIMDLVRKDGLEDDDRKAKIQVLIDAVVDLNRTYEGKTPLAWAKFCERPQLVGWMQSKGFTE